MTTMSQTAHEWVKDNHFTLHTEMPLTVARKLLRQIESSRHYPKDVVFGFYARNGACAVVALMGDQALFTQYVAECERKLRARVEGETGPGEPMFALAGEEIECDNERIQAA